MYHYSNLVNKQYGKKRNSSTSVDENNHSISNGMSLPLQSFVDDIPFQFNPKYRTIIVSNIDVPEYDTSKLRDIISKPIDFTLENKVLLEALEDLKRKKKEIEADNLRQQSLSVSTNYQSSNSSSVVTDTLSVNHRSISPTGGSIPVKTVPPPPPSSFHLPSVRDIYWPSINQQEYNIPTTYIPNLPVSINPSQLSSDSVKQTNHSFNNSNSIYTNDLAATFDERLTSGDPFHDAELKSLNDVAELNHLYSVIGSTNTIRR